MRKTVLILAMAMTIILTGCGRKEAPQAIADSAPPAITGLKHIISGNSLKLNFSLTGGQGGIGYQIDRAEIDPHCNCPSFWRRHLEELPQEKLRGEMQSQLFNLQTSDRAFAFRIRAVDSLGRLGKWSKVIRARSEIDEE